MLGAAGGVAGCFAGYSARTGIVKALGTQDIYVALLEDLTAVAGSLWVVSQLQKPDSCRSGYRHREKSLDEARSRSP